MKLTGNLLLKWLTLCTSILLISSLSLNTSNNNKNIIGRRDALQITKALLGSVGISIATTTITPPSSAAATTLDGYHPENAVTAASAGRSYFPPLTPPLTNRATYRYELGRDAWALEQLLVFGNVTATIRTIVVKMKDSNDLWVNGPQWPTGEFCQLLEELGTVKHVVLPCNALEHKAPMKAFTQRYPQASVWIAPGQYGPFGTCALNKEKEKGCHMGYRVDGVLPVIGGDDALMPPWADEFEMRTLYVSLPENAGPVSEAAFVHKPSKTLITTDSVVFVPDGPPPPIFGTYFDSNTLREPGFWPKTVLQSVFLPLRQGSEDGIITYPGYEATRGRLIRAPILRAFSDARAPKEVKDWVQSILTMGSFDRILTSHFASPIASTPEEYAAAFKYLDGPTSDPPIACQDWALLDSLNAVIDQNKLGAPVVFDFKAGCPPK